MARVAGDAVSTFDQAVLRGWARTRAAVLVLGSPAFASATVDLAPSSSVESQDEAELADIVRGLPRGAMIVLAGRRRRIAMRTIHRAAVSPVTVLWFGYARRYRDHRVERRLTPVRLISGWAVFEVPGNDMAELDATN